jgi:hypothetical protein
MQIPEFPAPIQFTDLGPLIKERLIDDFVVWPEQAVPLVGYMAWPNDAPVRSVWRKVHQCDNKAALGTLARKLKNIQQHWSRVADIVHLHSDLAHGQHQMRRGGASVGKAIALIDASAKSKGTGTSKLWEIWKKYKDVAHLVAAASLISGEAQTRHRMTPYGLSLHQFQPFRMAMLLPELVISVAMTIENLGLQHVAQGQTKPLFDPETLWRVPADINLTPLELLVRKITKADIAVLNARRAGNRGKAKRAKTTPVFS